MRHLTRTARLCGLVAAGPLVAGSMALPAHALPVFTEHDLSSYSNARNATKDDCTVADSPPPADSYVPVAENGAPTALSTSNAGTLTLDADPTDVISFATSATTVGRVMSVGGDPGVIELTMNGTVQADTTKLTSTCLLDALSGGMMYATFNVAHGGFMTFTTRASRRGYGEASINNSTRDVLLALEGMGAGFSGVASVYLPPGEYFGHFEADAYLHDSATAVPSTPVAVSIGATFAVAGSQNTAVSGKGGRYLTFPATRSCSTDSVDVAVTGKRKQARQIRKVRLFVNDARVKALRNPDKGQLVRLSVPAEAEAEVRAEVTLEPAKPGRKPKTHEVTAGYIACSAS